MDTFENTLSVSQYLSAVNEQIAQLKAVVAGEVTGRVSRRGGVTYFSLHDPEEEAVLQCMAFNSILDKQGVEIAEGMAIKVYGYPEIWKRSGYFSFKVFQVLLTGEGDLKKQFELLFKKLEKEGLFSAEYKKPIPSFASKIGLITAEGREAMTDFLTHLPKHALEISLYDVRVEGAQAIEQITAAIKWFNESAPETEVLVLTRGGGNPESLQAFNSEEVVRAIFASRIPVISGVGHEKDVTLADFVADVRASTPTHAAKIIAQDWHDAMETLKYSREVVVSGARSAFEKARVYLDRWQADSRAILDFKINRLRQTLGHFSDFIKAASPELKLKQGYSITRGANGKIINSIAKLVVDDMLDVEFYDGKAKTKITKLA